MPPKGKKHGCQTASLDILCSLPENVIDGILMCLPLREAVRTSILSQKEFLAAGAGELPKMLPFNLNCVKRPHLANIYLGGSDVVSCALCLIRSFPYLQYLEIEVGDEDDDIASLEYLEVEAFSDMTFNHLREVKLIYTIGSDPEMQLIKLLLAKSPILVKMLIEPCLEANDDAHKTVNISRKLNSFRRASPEVEVDYNCYYD